MEIGKGGGNFGEGVWSKEVVTIKENEVITGSNFDARIASFGEASILLVNNLDIFAILCYNGRWRGGRSVFVVLFIGISAAFLMGTLICVADLASGIVGAVVDEDDFVIPEILAEDRIETDG